MSVLESASCRLCVVSHDHRHGVTTYLMWLRADLSRLPRKEQKLLVASLLNIGYEPDRDDEWLYWEPYDDISTTPILDEAAVSAWLAARAREKCNLHEDEGG